MNSIVIFGCGGHAKVVFSEIIKLKKYKIIGFIGKSNKKKIILKYNKKNYYNIGTLNVLKKIKKVCGIIGIGDNYLRKKISKEVNLKYKKFNWVSIISKDSIINSNVKIGLGTLIVSKTVINNGTKIGSHCLINTSSSIDHDNTFEDFSSTGPSVTTGGNVKVYQLSHLGIGAVIKNKIKIGSNTIIGGKSFVNKDCLKNSVYFGIPAKRKKSRKLKEKYL